MIYSNLKSVKVLNKGWRGNQYVRVTLDTLETFDCHMAQEEIDLSFILSKISDEQLKKDLLDAIEDYAQIKYEEGCDRDCLDENF